MSTDPVGESNLHGLGRQLAQGVDQVVKSHVIQIPAQFAHLFRKSSN